MQPFHKVTGIVAPLDAVNVDTDQIVPKQFLKRVERSGFGQFLFFDWRFFPDGRPDPKFVLHQPRFAGASILVTGRNFGCGSSREHAVWALADFGIRAVVAPSFADIFAGNCLRNGLLPVALAEAEVRMILTRAQTMDQYQLTVDLETTTVADAVDLRAEFHMDPSDRTTLLAGLDEIGLTLQHEGEIAGYECRIQGR